MALVAIRMVIKQLIQLLDLDSFCLYEPLAH